jgi:signal peptidase II
MTPNRRGVLVASAAIALVIDVASKMAAVAGLDDGPIRLGPLLTLRLVHNAGIAFGLARGAPDAVVLCATAAVATTVATLAWRGVVGSPLPAGLVAGGALANVVDRATGGSVVDFLDVGRWPAFNLADVFLVSGIALVLLRSARPAPSRADEIDAIHESIQGRTDHAGHGRLVDPQHAGGEG